MAKVRLELKNDFHNTETFVMGTPVKSSATRYQVPTRNLLAASRRLCGFKDCLCGGVRSPEIWYEVIDENPHTGMTEIHYHKKCGLDNGRVEANLASGPFREGPRPVTEGEHPNMTATLSDWVEVYQGWDVGFGWIPPGTYKMIYGGCPAATESWEKV